MDAVYTQQCQRKVQSILKESVSVYGSRLQTKTQQAGEQASEHYGALSQELFLRHCQDWRHRSHVRFHQTTQTRHIEQKNLK